MTDDFEEDFGRHLNRPISRLDNESFMRQMNQRIGRARRLRTLRATILALAIVWCVGAAFFVTHSFLRMAGSELVDANPTAALAFWFPYGVIAVTLAFFLRALVEQAFRHFMKW